MKKSVKETTWHQDRRPINPASDDKWNVYDNPPGKPASIMSFSTKEEAEAYVDRRTNKFKNGGEHCRIIPPKNLNKQTGLDERNNMTTKILEYKDWSKYYEEAIEDDLVQPSKIATYIATNTKDPVKAQRGKVSKDYMEKLTAWVRKKKQKLDESSLSYLIENELEKAELLLAARGIPDKLQDMAEKLASIEADDVMPLLDQLKAMFGPQASARFSQATIGKIRELLDEVLSAKDAIDTEISNLEGVASGEPVANDMTDAMADDGGDMGGDALDAPMPPQGDAPDMDGGDEDEADGLPSEEDIEDADGLGDSDNAAGRMRKESKTIRGRQISESVRKLRESKNPDALILSEFRNNLSKHSVKEAANRTAKTFRIDLSDVINIVLEAKKDKCSGGKDVFGKKCPPFQRRDTSPKKSPSDKKQPSLSLSEKKEEMTLAQAKKIASDLGLVITHSADDNEYRVNFKGGKESTAYYTNDIKDAVATAKKMKKPIAESKKVSENEHYRGLKKWVSDYKDVRKSGNVKLAKSIRDNIEQAIKKNKLDAKRVWGDDPDAPKSKKLAEAVPQAPRTPAQMRADADAKKNGGNTNGTQNTTPDDEGTDMPGSVLTGTAPKPSTPPAQQNQNPNQTQNPNKTVNGTNTQNPSNQSGQPNQQQKTPAGNNAGNNPQNQNGEEEDENGNKQMLQSGMEGPSQKKVKPEVGFRANRNGEKVSMMSTTRPMPKPEHTLMSSGMATRKNTNESALLRKYITEFDSIGAPTDIEKQFGFVDEPEDKPEAHARLLGYVIRDNLGHTHGRKWIPNEETGGGHDEGQPKLYPSREEAHSLAREWTDRESEHDEIMLDKIFYTVGALYSNGEYRFPA